MNGFIILDKLIIGGGHHSQNLFLVHSLKLHPWENNQHSLMLLLWFQYPALSFSYSSCKIWNQVKTEQQLCHILSESVTLKVGGMLLLVKFYQPKFNLNC